MNESRKDKLDRARNLFTDDFINQFAEGLSSVVNPIDGDHFSKQEAKSLVISLIGAIVDDKSESDLNEIIERKLTEFGVAEATTKETESMCMVRVATTPQFYALCEDSKNRNRGPNDELLKRLDLNGVHVLAFHFLHNNEEWRGQWLCKAKDTDVPITVWMDNSFEAYEHYTDVKHMDNVKSTEVLDQ